MNESILFNALGQVSTDNAGDVFRTHLHTPALQRLVMHRLEQVARLADNQHWPRFRHL